LARAVGTLTWTRSVEHIFDHDHESSMSVAGRRLRVA